MIAVLAMPSTQTPCHASSLARNDGRAARIMETSENDNPFTVEREPLLHDQWSRGWKLANSELEANGAEFATAQNEGRAARRNGFPISKNPYALRNKGPDYHSAWIRGWIRQKLDA